MQPNNTWRYVELHAAVLRADAGNSYALGSWFTQYLTNGVGRAVSIMLANKRRHRLSGRPRKHPTTVPETPYAARVAEAVAAADDGELSLLIKLLRPQLSADEADLVSDYFLRRLANRGSGRRVGSGQHLVRF